MVLSLLLASSVPAPYGALTRNNGGTTMRMRDAGGLLKRRGLLAGGRAAMTAIVTKVATPDPVSAATMSTDTNNIATADTGIFNTGPGSNQFTNTGAYTAVSIFASRASNSTI